MLFCSVIFGYCYISGPVIIFEQDKTLLLQICTKLQGECGSCYAFASMGMLEARVRIMTNNTQTPVFSPQEIVSCRNENRTPRCYFPFASRCASIAPR